MTLQAVTFEVMVLGAGYMAAFGAEKASATVSDHHVVLIANNAIRAADEVLHLNLIPSARVV
jgi:hypothetical protein